MSLDEEFVTCGKITVPVPSFYIFTVGGLSVHIMKIFTVQTATSTRSNDKILYKILFYLYCK